MAEFFAEIDGWNRVHGAPEKPEPPTEEQFEQMLAEKERRQ